jgi:UTP--glucose-1-phosphate uridylyltransferase
MNNIFIKIEEKMKDANLDAELISEFIDRVKQVQEGETGIVNWDHVHDLVPSEDEISLEEIQKKFPFRKETLTKLAVVKLNGGLGTSMGLSKAKSLAVIKDDLPFLSVIVKQIESIRSQYSVDVPLIFMDSYNTQTDCQELLKQMGFQNKHNKKNENAASSSNSFSIVNTSFLQNKVPRLLKETLEPVRLSQPKEEWCPPGHGDIYLSMKFSKILDQLLQNGIEYLFISNGDNLGATVEPNILEYIYQNKIEFAMEMTPKTLADKKGGAIYRKVIDGKFIGYELLETAQVPKDHEHEFSGMGKFRTFSTNNLWVSLKALKQKMDIGPLKLSLIVNPKTIENQEVLQLETAMGSAIGNFQSVKGIIIPRERFAPVKKCEDILIRRSDAYILKENFSLVMNPKRLSPGLGENLVSLDDTYYKKLPDFERLFQQYPSLVHSVSFTVKGEIEFDQKIEVFGDVTFINSSGTLKKVSSLQRTVFKDEVINLS